MSETSCRGHAPAPLTERLANALAAMRSAGELLRDCPDLSLAERRRFATIVVDEGERAHRLMAEALDARR